MRLYTVYAHFFEGDSIRLGMTGENDTIVQKVKELLQDNGGGTAEVYNDDFYTIVEA